MLDRELHYLVASHRWVSDYGLEGQELIGRCHYDVFPEVPARVEYSLTPLGWSITGPLVALAEWAEEHDAA